MQLAQLKTLDLSYCEGFTDEAIAAYVRRAPAALEKLDLNGTHTTVPEATRSEGLAAVRRYYAQLEADAVVSTHGNQSDCRCASPCTNKRGHCHDSR